MLGKRDERNDVVAVMDYDYEKMLYVIPPEKHRVKDIMATLNRHPEVRFVSFVGIDIGGHDTDEKIPMKAFLKDMEKMLISGVQTDGSSVVLPKIANLNNAKVDIVPDMDVNWYVDHNLKHVDLDTGLPVGTLRIPAFLRHNDTDEVGSRVVLRDSVKAFKQELLKVMRENPYVFENLGVDDPKEIDEIVLTSATELEFWVRTPDDQSDREELSTAQELKEQYWKRTIGPVRTALEKTLLLLDQYGFEVEMGHKEVGGVKARLGNAGHYDHIMEQLEIDWKYSTAMQAADNENQIKYIVRDVYRIYGLDVTFTAKPMPGVAGSGEHTHLGVAARLRDGTIVNLFSPKDMHEDFLSPIGFGGLMGLLKNYDVVNPFVSAVNNAFDRLKPGFEAPVCVVTSLGHDVENPSRNRTVLAGLVRDIDSPLATRFELRSPNPKSNTYLVLASCYMAMLDGIRAALQAGKTSKELEKSISKEYGEEDFYLDTNRIYRSEKHVFDDYTQEERDKMFGKAPRTVWENLKAFDEHADKLKIFELDDVMTPLVLESYREATLAQWVMELHNRIVPNTMGAVRQAVKRHDEETAADIDRARWSRIEEMKYELGKDTLKDTCLLTQISDALEAGEYDKASTLQVEMQDKLEVLMQEYDRYKRNLF